MHTQQSTRPQMISIHSFQLLFFLLLVLSSPHPAQTQQPTTTSTSLALPEPFRGHQRCPLTSIPSSSSSEQIYVGYASLTTLRNDILARRILQQPNALYRICPHTEWHLDLPLELSSQFHITLQCELRHTCLFKGGTTQLTIRDFAEDPDVTPEPVQIRIRGMVLEGATHVATKVIMADTAAVHITFEDCIWQHMPRGDAVVSVLGKENESQRRRRWQQEEGGGGIVDSLPSSIQFQNVQFLSNRVQSAVLKVVLAPSTTPATEIVLNSTKFQSNTIIAGSVAEIWDDNTTARILGNTAFRSNGYTGGELFLQQEQQLVLGKLRSSGGGSDDESRSLIEQYDVRIGDGGGRQEEEIIQNTTVDNVMLQLDAESTCIDDAEELQETLTLGAKTEIEICNDAILELDEDPLEVVSEEIKLFCKTSCVLVGGLIRIAAAAAQTGIPSVQFENLSLIQTRVNIETTSLESLVVMMRNVEFAGHSDAAAALYIGEGYEQQTTWTSYQDVPAAVNASSGVQVSLVDCSFQDSRVVLAPIVNNGGVLNVTSTFFLYNHQSEAGGILAFTDVVIQDSCFMRNTGTLAGSILSTNSLDIITQTMNYGADNSINSTNNGTKEPCADIYALADLECQFFEAEECQAEMTTIVGCNGTTRAGGENGTDSSSCIDHGDNMTDVNGGNGTVPNTDCVSDWPTLLERVDESTGNEVIRLCTNTSFEVDLDSQPLLLNIRNVSIVCEGCAIIGGARHIEISQGGADSIVRGITFMGASDISVAGRMTAVPFLVRFEDCNWVNNEGVATMLFAGPSGNTTPTDDVPTDDLLPGTNANRVRWLQDADSGAVIDSSDANSNNTGNANETSSSGNATDSSFDTAEMDIALEGVVVGCFQCVFEGNTASEAIIVADSVSLDFDLVQFNDNVADGSIFHVNDGVVALTGTCLVGNELDTAQGLVAGDGNVNLDGVYGENNTASGGDNSTHCNGFVEGTSCQSFDSSYCRALSGADELSEAPSTFADQQPTAAPDDPGPDGCFNTWNGLKMVVETADFTVRDEKIFILCADTTLNASDNSAIEIHPDDGVIIFQCGDDPELLFNEGNCSIHGGESHFIIGGSPKEISFRNIIFSGASYASILSHATDETALIFARCIWTGNSGVAAILNYHEDIFGEDNSTDASNETLSNQKFGLGGALSRRSNGDSSSLVIDVAHFFDNEFSIAGIVAISSRIDVQAVGFERHGGLSAGPIAIFNKSKLSLVDSCFVENESITPGMIYIDATSEIQSHFGNNFGVDNIIGNGSDVLCDGIFEAYQSCLEDGACEGFCASFEAGGCLLPYIVVPTDAPSRSPWINETIAGQVHLEEVQALSSLWNVFNLIFMTLTCMGGCGSYFFCLRYHTAERAHKKETQGHPTQYITSDDQESSKGTLFRVFSRRKSMDLKDSEHAPSLSIMRMDDDYDDDDDNDDYRDIGDRNDDVENSNNKKRFDDVEGFEDEPASGHFMALGGSSGKLDGDNKERNHDDGGYFISLGGDGATTDHSDENTANSLGVTAFSRESSEENQTHFWTEDEDEGDSEKKKKKKKKKRKLKLKKRMKRIKNRVGGVNRSRRSRDRDTVASSESEWYTSDSSSDSSADVISYEDGYLDSSHSEGGSEESDPDRDVLTRM